MSTLSKAGHDVAGASTRWAIGFFGVLTAIMVLPRLIRFAVRHYAFRLIAEIIAIVSFGLLTEKVVEWAAEHERDSVASE
jgi:hypothetical protein